MISELHGKHYYIELESEEELQHVAHLLDHSILKDEGFDFIFYDHRKWVACSKAKCGEWRGPKYSAWEKVKRDIYRFRKENESV